MSTKPPPLDDYPNEAPYVIAALFLMFAFIVAWPWTSKLIDRLKGPPQTEYLGVVQSISFVGGFGMTTQVQTDTHTFLVNGAWSLPRGTRLERRETITAHLVCIIDTDVCDRLLSRLTPAPNPNLRTPS
jgi:hypothetical protein